MIGEKVVAGVEMILMIGMLFSFCYFVGFEEVSLVSGAEKEKMTIKDFLDKMGGGKLTENQTWKNYPISMNSEGAGCCFASNEGQVCGTTSPENCISDSPFAEGALCAATSFCEKGCCYDDKSGTYDKNVLKFACPAKWVKDPNCNLPGARLGCCVLGSKTIFETEGQCEVDSLVFAMGDDDIVDWRTGVDEGACLFLAAEQKEGACVIREGECKFVSEAECFSYGGDFAEGSLCTNPSLNTSCKMTKQTKCVDGKDGVYFVDSCGNVGNIYDSSRVEDVSYWDSVVQYNDSCGAGEGNGDSPSCGNCNRFAGGICASASEDNFKVEVGSFYCRDTSCMFDGVKYDNGESWCVYDGAIGNGNDVVGSRHWKYVCSQGVVQIEPCADYRNQICVQSKEFEVDGKKVEFDNAACIANNWRECINLNSEDADEVRTEAEKKACTESRTKLCGNYTLYPSNADKINCLNLAASDCASDKKVRMVDKCSATLNCRVEKVAIADKFTFDVCLPKYPGGFALNDARYQTTAERLCGMASQTCTVVRASKKWGGCRYVANQNCLSETFGQEMNDFCRGLGDCGGSVNIVGEWSGNYIIRNSPGLSESWIAKLSIFATPVPGQFAEVEDYSEYLAAAGVWGGAVTPTVGGEEEKSFDFTSIGVGVAGLGLAIGAANPDMKGAIFSMARNFIPFDKILPESFIKVIGPYSGAMIGAGIGFVVGQMLGQYLGLSEGGSMLMGLGGAAIGAAYMLSPTMTVMLATPLFWVGVALIVISLFFGRSKCPPIEVDFECKPWQAPVGGNDCEECNDDPLKPCSRYRCESLGAGCELINEGSGDELCVDGNPGDATPPIIHRQTGIDFEGGDYEDGENGFSIVNDRGGCVLAYTPLPIGIVTSEPAQCKFDVAVKDFDDMVFSLGGNSYLYNHTAVFNLPDPSHGQSQGSNWTGDLSLYVKCRDRYGLESPGIYEIKTCVIEGEDVTAPKIVASEGIGNVGFDVTNKDVMIVTNELATCKWDLQDVDYSEMGNDMVCGDSLGAPSNALGYVCNGVFAIGNSSNNYYVRCMDQPWENDTSKRNANAQSFVFNLVKPSSKISIDKIKPDNIIEINTDFTTIDLKVATSGGGVNHFCSYSFSGYGSMIEMFETGDARTHVQTLNVGTGAKKIYVECSDENGDVARGLTEFRVVQGDFNVQGGEEEGEEEGEEGISSIITITRIWEEQGRMNLLLNGAGECRYSFTGCKFDWEDGVSIGEGDALSFSVDYGKKYFIQCEDKYGNLPSRCLAEIVAI